MSIPTAILDGLPLGEEENMWINDDTTWNLTAQQHKLSGDVMHPSSLGEEKKKDVKKSQQGLLLLDLTSMDSDSDESQRGYAAGVSV